MSELANGVSAIPTTSRYNTPTPERQLHDLIDAMIYFADCSAATVAHMAGLKRKSKAEYRRHISITRRHIELISPLSTLTEKQRKDLTSVAQRLENAIEACPEAEG
jgi:hypothetical protein